MDSFNFFFGVELGHNILNMADNLSSSLQASNMSANKGQSIMKMTILTLGGMRSEECFLLFWERTEKKRQELGVEAHQLPRQRKVYQEDLRWGLQFLRQKNQWKTYTGRHTMR